MAIDRDTEWLAMCNAQASQLVNTARGRLWDGARIGREAADIVDAIYRQRDARNVEDAAADLMGEATDGHT